MSIQVIHHNGTATESGCVSKIELILMGALAA